MNAAAQATAVAEQPDDRLLDLVQRQTLNYFWEFGHPVSGMARERSNPVAGYDFLQTVCTGGTGFGIMAMLAGASRGFLPRTVRRDAGGTDRVRYSVGGVRHGDSGAGPLCR